MPSGPQLLISLLFSLIGYFAWRHGRRESDIRALIIGITLMFYPYLVPNVWAMFGVGVALTAGLFLFRD